MANEHLTITLSSNETAAFADWQTLEDWLGRERAQWAWLMRGDPKTDSHNWATNVQGAWENTIQGVRNIMNSGSPVSEAGRALSQLTSGNLITSDSLEGDLVLQIRETAGDTAAAFAYALLKGGVQPNSAKNRDELLGAILTVIPDMRQSVSISDRLQKERTNYRYAIKSAIATMNDDDLERKSRFDDEISNVRRIAAKILQSRRNAWQSVQSAWQQRADEAVDSIRSVEKAYLESMRLQAPVKYWNEKADIHSKKEILAIIRLCIFFPTSTIGLIIAFYESSILLLGDSSGSGKTVPAALYIIITGGLAALSTFVFWIGRLLTKIYLSEHHLRNDASERAVMTQTYLALTKDQAASDVDRNIILSALFRNTPDGIIKEDGPPDLNLQAILSRIAVR